MTGIGRQWMPRKPVLSESVRGTVKTEFSSILTSQWTDYLRYSVLSKFENMLNEVDTNTVSPFNFDNREWQEYLPAHILPQVLSRAIMEQDPEIYTHYMESEDLLLLALHRRTPRG